MRLFRGFVVTSASQVATLVAALITRVFMARLLGPAGYGGFGVAVNLVTVLSKALAFGALPATQYFASKGQESREDLLRTVLTLGAVLGVALTGFALLVLPRVGGFYFSQQPIAAAIYPLLALGILPIVVGGVIASVLIPWGRVPAYATTQLMPSVLVLIGLLALLAVTSPLQAAALAYLAAWTAAMLYGIWVVRRGLSGGRFRSGLAKDIARYGLVVWPNVLLGVGSSRIAIVLGAVFVSGADMGLFVIALNVVEGVFAFHAPIGQLLFTRVSEREHQAFGIAQESMRVSVFVLLGLSLVFVAVGRPMITWVFGRDFAASWLLALVLIGTGVSHSLMRVLNNFVAGMGRPGLNTITLGVETGLLIALVPLFAVSGSPLGLAVASVCSALAALLVATAHSCSIMRCRPATLYLTRRSDLARLGRRVQDLFARQGTPTRA
jgi:O-antigen/teichoic acid export membrane protein